MITGYAVKTECEITKTLKQEDFQRRLLYLTQNGTRFKAKIFEFDTREQMLKWLRKPMKFLKPIPKDEAAPE